MNRTGTSRYGGPGGSLRQGQGRSGLHLVFAGGIVMMLLLIPHATAAINGKIAFHSDRTGHYEVYVIKPDGSGQTPLTSDYAAISENPAWSPDGEQIVFDSNREGNCEIYVMDADGSNQTRLTSASVFNGMAAWSPNGTRIAFESDRDGNMGIFVMDTDGSNQTRLTNTSVYGSYPAWSPDSGKIVFASDLTGHNEVFSMNADGSDQTQLTSTGAGTMNGKPSWSPDGTKIAFESTRDGNYQVYVMDPDGSNQTRLTDNTAFEWSPAWSPDGKRIAFTSFRTGTAQVYIMNADGSGQTAVTANEGTNDAPKWYGPAVKSIAPKKGKRGKTVTTNLTGAGFAPGVKAFLIRGGKTIKGKTNTWINLTAMNCTFKIPSTAQTGKWSVKVTNPDGVAGSRANAFTVK